MSSPIPAVYKSIIRAVNDLVTELNSGGLYGQISYHNWENRADEDKLPRHTLIGLDGFGFDENQGRWVIRLSVAISSYRDANLLNEIEMIGKIHERFEQGGSIDMLNLTTGVVENQLHISEFEVMPMAQSELRNYRVIGMELLRAGI